MSWEIIEIGSLCEIGRGSSPRPINNRAYFDGGDIPWIKIADATSSGKEIVETKEHVNSYGASFSRLLPIGSLILATSGVSLGQVKLLGVEGCIHDGWIYIKNYNGIEKEFLYYKLIELEKHFHSESYGAAIQNINTDILRRTKISLPPLQTQKRIASILSAYDDLIENNLKRIKLLEETAQNIYKEWFVNFRFPNYENTPFNEETGLPEGWEKGSFYEYVDIMSGGTPKTNTPEYYDGQIPFYTPKDASSNPYIYIKNTEKKITEVGLQKCNSKLYPQNTVFITARGTVGKVNLAMRPMAMNQSCYALKFKQNHSPFFLLAITFEAVEIIKKTATGGVFDTIVVDTFKRIPIVYPNNEVIVDYQNFVEPIFQQTIKIQEQINLLKEARDVLLPRFMNRTIEV
jgi:type I restriction enzyme S subunit